jgi:hypothetical protein
MKYYYSEPNNTTKYKIIETWYQGDVSYTIQCIYFQRKFTFFGKKVEKTSLLTHIGCKAIASFSSLSEAQKELIKFNTNSVKVVKEIEKRQIKE